jgi:hypothetical protein
MVIRDQLASELVLSSSTSKKLLPLLPLSRASGYHNDDAMTSGFGRAMRSHSANIAPLVLAASLLVCLACGDTTSADRAQPGTSPATSAAAILANPAAASPKPTSKPTPKKSPVPVQTVVRFLNAPLTVTRGSYATLQARTSPNKSCSIEVDYKSGKSSAAGLGAKASNASGNVTWTWKVGAGTTRGAWPIIVTCGNGSAETHINVV